MDDGGCGRWMIYEYIQRLLIIDSTPLQAHTGAARSAVVNLTETLSVEWAMYGVRINAVAPGVIHSSGLSNYPPAVQQSILSSSSANIPLRRLGTVREVAATVVFLLSPGSAFITGATIRVDGGGSLYRPHFEVPMHHSSSSFDDLISKL